MGWIYGLLAGIFEMAWPFAMKLSVKCTSYGSFLILATGSRLEMDPANKSRDDWI